MNLIKHIVKLMFSIIVFGVAIVSVEYEIMKMIEQKKYLSIQVSDEEFRAKFFSNEQMANKFLYEEECKTILHNVENDVSYYPVANSTVDKSLNTSFKFISLVISVPASIV